MGHGAIGYIAALLTTFSIIPQIIRVIKLKESRDISLWTISSLSAGILLWLIHGIIIGDLPGLYLQMVFPWDCPFS